MSPHGHETALRGPIELFHALIAAAATAVVRREHTAVVCEAFHRANS